jgi:hypothetical protein
MEPLLAILIMLIVLETTAFISFIVIRNKKVNELKSEINLYSKLTGEESRNNDAIVFVANLNNYSLEILKRLNKLIIQSYQRFMIRWPLDCFGRFLNELDLVGNQEKKDFIKNTFTYALGSISPKIIANIITTYLNDNGTFEEDGAQDGLEFIIFVVLKHGDASNMAINFKLEFEKNIQELINSPEKNGDEKVLIQAGSIKIKKMLSA